MHTDHEALLGFKKSKNINWWLAWYVVKLADYDLVLKHKPGKENKIADALSQWPDYDTGEDDNKGVVVLPETMFIKSTTLQDPPFSTINESIIAAQATNFALIDPLIQPHNLSHPDNLWWKGNILIVVGDNNLKKGVLHFYHDTLVARHPGILNTFSLLKYDYWWPNMKQFVTDYVKGCAQCQANKANTHKSWPPLYPIKPQNTLPFETITLDFITKLSKSRGFDTILKITDHDCSKAALFIPYREEIDRSGVAQLYLRHIFPHYGLP